MDAEQTGTESTPSEAWKPPPAIDDGAAVQRQVQKQAGIIEAPTGGGTLFTEPVLVVNQKVKLIELVAEFKVYDQQGNQIGSVAQTGQSALKKALRLLSSLDQYMTHTYEIRDAQGQPVLVMVRPRKFFKSKFRIERPDGSLVGTVVQKNMIGKIRFALEAGGQEVGSLNAENWRAWNFNIKDASGNEVARITKTWEGLLKTAFTSADNYVLQMHEPLADPLLSLVVATSLCVDTALKQDQRGFN